MNQCPKCNRTHNKAGRFCSRSCANSRAWSEEDKQKKSIASKQSIKVKEAQLTTKLKWKGYIKPILSNQPKPTCLICKLPIDVKRGRSNKVKYHLACYRTISGGFRLNSTNKHRSIYNNSQMDSGSELAFVKLLDFHNIKWIKNENQYFPYIGNDGKPRKYYPDFYLPAFDLWVEIKGEFYAARDENLQHKLFSVKKCIILYTKQIQKLIKVPNDLYLYLLV